jgi:hypothetical protein
MQTYIYNDLLFEIYHYILHFNLPILNKISKRANIIDKRIKRYVYYEKYNDVNECLYEGCKTGDMNLVLQMIERGADDWNWGLNGACIGGHMKIIKFMIEKGAICWNWGLGGACQGGNMKIVKLMIKKGANDWNWGLGSACQYKGISIKLIAKINNWPFSMALPNCPLDLGYMKIMKLMIKRGATECDNCDKSIPEHLLKK